MKTVRLTVFEMEVLRNLITSPVQGCAVKDLRMINKGFALLNSKIPGPVEHPFPKGAEPDVSQEEQQAKVQAYQAAVEARLSEEVMVDIDTGTEVLFKSRLAMFKGFSPENGIRERIVALADKLGVE